MEKLGLVCRSPSQLRFSGTLHLHIDIGKSMLIDLFADCLPTKKKKRWHYTTFMLETFAKLEQLRRSRQMIIPTSLGTQDDYSLLWLAREMISTSPILFLDEFQLPDRAAAKIITNLMTSFFHLGGVLIATSNRMPEELAKAAGMEFTPPPTRLDSLSWTFGLGGSRAAGRSEKMFAKQQGEFAGFLDVLKARCDVWEMQSGKDYRRRESELGTESLITEQTLPSDVVEGFEGLQRMAPGNIGLGYEQSVSTEFSLDETNKPFSTLPRNYLIRPSSTGSKAENETWLHAFNSAQLRAAGVNSDSADEIPWKTGSMRVYGRDVLIPRQHSGTTSWTFAELCFSSLGPADYITLASTYHTIILSDVPVLTTLQKNEARRFITLLDALYEARCKLLISADVGPDDLFFPETKKISEPTADQDAIYAETISEVYQDATAPFRPNISMYDSASPGSSTTTSSKTTLQTRLSAPRVTAAVAAAAAVPVSNPETEGSHHHRQDEARAQSTPKAPTSPKPASSPGKTSASPTSARAAGCGRCAARGGGRGARTGGGSLSTRPSGSGNAVRSLPSTLNSPMLLAGKRKEGA